MKEILSRRFSRFAETYEKWAIPQRETAKRLVEFVKPSGLVLDVGCGTGFVTSLIPAPSVVIGIDLSPGMARHYSNFRGPCIVGDAEALPFRDSSFDFVLSSFTIHWTRIEESLKEMIRVSRGSVGLAIPVEGSLRETRFPFPQEEEILTSLSAYKLQHFTEEVNIPFRGWDLVRFFHYTGSSFNPSDLRIHTRKELENLINSIKRPVFRVLFLYARVK